MGNNLPRVWGLGRGVSMQFSLLKAHRSLFARWTCAAAIVSVGVLQGAALTPAGANSKPSGPLGYAYAATEGQHFNISGIADVAYGDHGKFNRKTGLTGGVDCNNTVFGNPDKGVTKACFVLADVGPAGYTYTATEGGHVKIDGLADVAYGSRGKFYRKTAVSGGIDCDNSKFGDPDKGVHKSCYVIADAGPAGYTYAATEGAHIKISGIADVAYGSRGKFNRKTGVTGGIDCTNAVFGNPDPGVQKSCYILADVGPAGYTYAGPEGAHITLTGVADVAYGDRGKFNRKTGVSGGIDCTNAVFGNPDVGVQKSCYVLYDAGPKGYTLAAPEGAHINITGVADVAYGDRGKFFRKTGVTVGIDCTNAVFGNPDPGVQKSCYTLADVGPTGFSYAGTEGSHLHFTGIVDVAYGAEGQFHLKTGVTSGIACDNSVFGDPDKGVHKSCYILADNGPAGFAYATTEGRHLHVTGTVDVAYGANGQFAFKSGVSGKISCGNDVFGDPNKGVHKSCYVKPH